MTMQTYKIITAGRIKLVPGTKTIISTVESFKKVNITNVGPSRVKCDITMNNIEESEGFVSLAPNDKYQEKVSGTMIQIANISEQEAVIDYILLGWD